MMVGEIGTERVDDRIDPWEDEWDHFASAICPASYVAPLGLQDGN